MKHIHAICLSVFLLLAGVQAAHAYEVKVQPDISISENYISNQNLYLASLRTWLNTTYDKDVVSVSYDQTIGGTIFGDVTLLGKNILLNGESFDDVRTIADRVTISGVVNKDLIIIARKVVIQPGAIINGDTLILAHTVDMQGQFLGKSQVTANQILVTGTIEGSTTFTASRIVFLGGSKVQSDLSYFSPQRAEILPGSEIQKELNFNQIESIQQNDVVKRLFFAFVSFWAIIKLIATLFVIFILTQMFKVFVQRLADSAKAQMVKMFVTGLISFISIPLLVVILFGSLVLIPVSIIVGCIFMIMIILLPATSAIITASLYQTYVRKENRTIVQFNMSALALILLTFLGFVPYVGSILVYATYALSFGAMTTYFYEQIRRKKLNL